MRVHDGRALDVEGAVILAGAEGDEGSAPVLECRDAVTDALDGVGCGCGDCSAEVLEGPAHVLGEAREERIDLG